MSEHYFTARPETGHRPGRVHVLLPDVHLELATDAGVFSPGRVDPGTRLLLDVAADPPGPPAGDLLDLGCGYGPIALVLASRAPAATVWAVDVNERALDLCARNAAHAGLANVRCATPDDPALPAAYAGIWSNPPIRVGKQALHELLGGWLPRLAPDAAATAVVQRHLGADSLHRWLAAQGWDARRIASRAGYRILRITRPPAPEDTDPQDTDPQDTAPQDTAPQDTAPQDTAPQDTAPQDTAPQDTAPQDTAPQDTAPQDTAPQDTDPQDTDPQDTP